MKALINKLTTTSTGVDTLPLHEGDALMAGFDSNDITGAA